MPHAQVEKSCVLKEKKTIQLILGHFSDSNPERARVNSFHSIHETFSCLKDLVSAAFLWSVHTYEVPHMEKWPVNMTHELFSNMQGVNSKTSKRSHFKLKPKGLTFSCLYNHTCLLTFHLLTSRGENTPIFVQNMTLVITQKISKGGLISESFSL